MREILEGRCNGIGTVQDLNPSLCIKLATMREEYSRYWQSRLSRREMALFFPHPFPWKAGSFF